MAQDMLMDFNKFRTLKEKEYNLEEEKIDNIFPIEVGQAEEEKKE